ncbi:rhomboid family intramembrane serine protease [Vitiosangium sp. GDMCC 1.1324]|uniref:rhomboid family intramembrane serine protease n=1 Tax=Vitiosangium sp. (strain GDMCC 1.1324) TaxID=2138576 RepID=UPI000D372A24|nr:rhomboid family intramembrane serine protease [Vitiosangium sp. GDMCC 1.1324]PTL76063.1 hypothetical protein DAT35_52030 [Vitiosangium sp. GDMCC 1.1324]
MSHCPDDGKPLVARGAELSCPGCGGSCLSLAELEKAAPGVREQLGVETRETSGAFTRTRLCPGCGAVMAPLRMARLEAWLEHCTACELYWADRQDRRTLQMLSKREARRSVVASMPEKERQELARELAVVPETGPSLSPVHTTLAMLGLPVVTRTEGGRTPVLTWALAVVLVAIFLYGRGDPSFLSEMGFHSDEPSVLAALTANLVHFGWLHLLGNVYFLIAFGDGVEQKMSRPMMLGAFVLGGAVATAVDGLLSTHPTLTAGSSAGVAVVMGACFVLQPRARVVIRMVIQVPIWAFAVMESGFQLLMMLLDVEGVAWAAHLAGLVIGIWLGVVLRWGRGKPQPGPAAAR